uniref:Uncharacterized protein n=1 Tax=Glossina pallidipes TaxID=7398 RepID=A0A1B0AAT2_GLOPL
MESNMDITADIVSFKSVGTVSFNCSISKLSLDIFMDFKHKLRAITTSTVNVRCCICNCCVHGKRVPTGIICGQRLRSPIAYEYKHSSEKRHRVSLKLYNIRYGMDVREGQYDPI